MKKPHLGTGVSTLFVLSFLSILVAVGCQSSSNDASVMQALKKSLNSPSSLGWTDSDPCNWNNVQCSNDNRVTRIQIGHQGLTGSLPPNLNNLTELQVFEVMSNQLSGSIPSFTGLGSLKTVLLNNNNFSSIPPDFFSGLNSLQGVYLDYNPFSAWQIPDSLESASALQNFSAVSANITGKIPDFLSAQTFPGLETLHLSYNRLEGGLPVGFSGSSIQSLWLNGQTSSSMLNGTIDVLNNMTQLTDVWLHSNSFSGPIPDLSGLLELNYLSLRDNGFTGPVPESVVSLPKLEKVNLTNNLLQGPTPKFNPSVAVDMTNDTNRFCLSDPGVPCDQRVNTLLSIAQSVGYPTGFAENWNGNDPCQSWPGITCVDGNITVLNFPSLGLTGTISPNFSMITSLQILILANNNLGGTIPNELTALPNLKQLDVSNNHLFGKIPSFRSNVMVNTNGNPDIGKDSGVTPSPGGTSSGNTSGSTSGSGGGTNASGSGGTKSSIGVVVGSVIGAASLVFIVGMGAFCVYRRKQKRLGRVQSPNTMVIHPRHSGSDQDTVKITVAGPSVNGGAVTEAYIDGSSGPRDIQIGNMVISIHILKDVTNNFSEENILGRGGFGTVYKGELHDGTKIAVKRMESAVVTDKGLDEFKSEIAVLTKVRHRHLVSLLGYCLDGNERLLVYEYMPQGTVSRYLFSWKEEGLKPLEWSKRLTIALDVARGVEYLHSLAHQSFVHRDLKPSNILLGDDMRAKVADFGLVRLAPDGKASIVTKLAGTFGYLAPEYAAMGRVTTKVDVFSFGVILMELITGRKALDETQQDDSIHLVAYFRRIHNKESFEKAIDPSIVLDDETRASISTVAELAGHCCARESYQRPDMSHAVNVLSSLAELWKPADPDSEDMYGIDFDMTLPQAVKKWQALEGMSGMSGVDGSSSYFGSTDNTQTSIPTRPSGFADSFTSADGR